MTGPTGGRRRRWRRLDRSISYGVLLLLVAAWIVLFATLPRVANRLLIFDIACRSGNPVVGVWIENSSGGSGWAQRGDSSRSRFIFQQPFDGNYEVRVGCGGNAEHWGVEARAIQADWLYRRLLCDDVDFTPPNIALCRDQLSG